MRRRYHLSALAALTALVGLNIAGCAPKGEEPAAQGSPPAAPQNVSTEEKAVPAVGKDGAPP